MSLSQGRGISRYSIYAYRCFQMLLGGYLAYLAALGLSNAITINPVPQLAIKRGALLLLLVLCLVQAAFGSGLLRRLRKPLVFFVVACVLVFARFQFFPFTYVRADLVADSAVVANVARFHGTTERGNGANWSEWDAHGLKWYCSSGDVRDQLAWLLPIGVPILLMIINWRLSSRMQQNEA